MGGMNWSDDVERRVLKMCWRVARRYGFTGAHAEDVVQSALIKCWQKVADGTWDGVNDNYFYTTAWGVMSKYVDNRTRQPIESVYLDLPDNNFDFPDPAPSASDVVVAAEMDERIKGRLAEIGGAGECMMAFMQGESKVNIAKARNVSASRVGQLLIKAQHKVSKLIESK